MRVILIVVLFSCTGYVLAQESTSAAGDTVLFANIQSPAQESQLPVDSTAIQERSFNESTLNELKQNEDFNYRQPPTVVESLWDRFINWLSDLFGWLFRGATSTNWGRVLLYTVGLIVLVVVVMMLLKVDALRVFKSGSDQRSVAYGAFTENIHEMDFEKLIHEALGKKEYRLGVRLTFLYALKLLSDKQHVDWKPGKTNHDYLSELKDGDLKTGFNELSFYFDYTWYGDFNVNQNLFERVQGIFNTWRVKVK